MIQNSKICSIAKKEAQKPLFGKIDFSGRDKPSFLFIVLTKWEIMITSLRLHEQLSGHQIFCIFLFGVKLIRYFFILNYSCFVIFIA